MYWILLCNADKENTTEDTVVETTEDTGEVEDSDTNDTQDTQEDTNVEDTGEVEEPPPPPKIVRFVAMGDGGEGNETSIKLQTFSKMYAKKRRMIFDGCEFVLYLGDNIYDVGVDDVLDEQFYDKFEARMRTLIFHFMWFLEIMMAVAGERVDFSKTEYQVDYTHYSQMDYVRSVLPC